MPMIPTRPDDGTLDPMPTTAAVDGGWLHGAQAWITPGTVTALAVITAAVLGFTAAWLLLRRSGGKSNVSRHLMYLPLLLVNAAAIYGQVAFFYESIAPPTWPIPGKLALAVLIAAAIESIAVYVGWHAHDALMQKASATAARLRRASYLLAGLVGAINYAHFADKGFFHPTAASIAFGLLSLLSPWLWGLHTRRAQHVQLRNEGAVDATGATFSGERIRSFPIRSYMARRWSIDHYVTDPREAWEGYNAQLARDRAIKPGTRVRAAWLVLRGHADIEPGVVPASVPDSRAGRSRGGRPGTGMVTAAGTGRAIEVGTGNGTRPDARAVLPAGLNPGANGYRKPAGKRGPSPGGKRAGKPTSAQAKAFKLKADNPDITWANLAARVGVNERTARRWFESARPAQDPEERASVSARMPVFAPPGPPVLAGVNGHHKET